MPKQFYPLFDQGSLFQSVIERNSDFSDSYAVAANREQSFIAFEQLASRGIRDKFGLIEPVGRNTAPAIALVAFSVEPSEIILVNPSDHLIINKNAYKIAVLRAKKLALDGKLVTFGIQPTSPETGYGYIEHEGENVLRFREKPDAKSAAEFLSSGRFLWNAGIFCFTAGTFLEELKKYNPEVYNSCKIVAEKAGARGSDSGLLEPSLEEMLSIPSISVDYAVLERSDRVSVVPCDIGWSDLGSFDSLYPVAYNSEIENAVLAECSPIFLDSKRNLVISRGNKKIVLIDMDDTNVIDTEDALLVMRRGSGQRVKEVVDTLKVESSPLLQAHTTVKRPWGSYTILLDTDRVKVKRIIVNPGQRISLQKHSFRQEHWVCIDGHGQVTLNNQIIPIERTAEVEIPAESVHRLECTGQEPLVIIETQIGSYFGEDDIIRLEDDYERAEKH
jgi:mannose-1-phosphate guanylyltransferase/mannose-6-phosphate isomerase